MTATERLRELLDKRGVEYEQDTFGTLWIKDEHGYHGAHADKMNDGLFSLFMWRLTPEQVIEATLGRGECEMEYAEHPTQSTLNALDVYFCSECGSPTYNDTKPYYCIYCGAKVSNR